MIDWTFSIGNVLTVIVMLCAGFGAWWTVKTQASQAIHDAEAARKKASDAYDAIHALRLEVATKYATTEAIKEVEERVVDAINRLGDRFDRYFEIRDNRRTPPKV